MSQQYSRSKYTPQYMRTKIFVHDSVPGRARELEAQTQIDHIALRIAEQSNRYKDARSLVRLVNSGKVPRKRGGTSTTTTTLSNDSSKDKPTLPKESKSKLKQKDSLENKSFIITQSH